MKTGIVAVLLLGVWPAGGLFAQAPAPQEAPATEQAQPAPEQTQPAPAPEQVQPAAAPEQAQPAVEQAQPAAQPAELVGDRFPALRAAADQARAAYEQLDKASMSEIDRLMRTRRCQIARIGGLLDRTVDSMNSYLEAEKKYWDLWGEAEQKRVEGEQRTLASMEEDQKRAADLVEQERRDHEELARRKAMLEQSRRTEEIAAQIDALIKDIQDSEARLAEAQRQNEALTVRINNFKAFLTARLVNIRQNRARLDAWGLEMNASYEKQRAAAQEICNMKSPDSRRRPLPRRSSER